jgi:hypothetical protein
MKYLVLFFLSLTAVIAKGAELFETNQSVRALGMGNAYLTSVSPTDAIFYNPAALAKVHGLNWEVVNAQVGVNGLDMYNDIRDTHDLSQPSDYNRFFGKNVWVGANGRSSFAFPYFGFAAYTSNYIDFQLHNPAYPQFNTDFISDYGFVVAGAIPFGDQASLGFSAKRINRWGGKKDIGVGSIAAGSNVDGLRDSFQDKGIGYGMDAAFQYTAPTPFSPSLALVWQDIGCTTFQRTSGTQAPPRIEDNLSIGVGTMMDLPGLDWSNSFDVRHITDNSVQFGQKIHLGTEISLPLIDLRAGINEGYLTYGAGVNLYFLKIDAAYYTEERGTYPGQTPDNRIQIGVSLDLSFDANFNFTDNSGKDRRLKQRR